MMAAVNALEFSQIKIGEISSKECCAGFRCGESSIDDWFCKKAVKHNQQDRTRVYCATRAGQGLALGFYALSFSSLGREFINEEHAGRYHEGTAPLVYINWLAVRREVQGKKLGTILLVDALKNACKVSRVVPFYGIALRSLNDRTTMTYKKHGFVAKDENRFPLMILPIWTALDLFGIKQVSA